VPCAHFCSAGDPTHATCPSVVHSEIRCVWRMRPAWTHTDRCGTPGGAGSDTLGTWGEVHFSCTMQHSTALLPL
jgi:hypothetical protein